MRTFGIVAFLAAAILGATSAQADDLALDHSGGGLYVRGSFTNFGWTFTTSEDRAVTALGLFDVGANGLVDAHEVGIWDSTGTLLVSAIVQSQALTPSVSALGDWRFASVASTYLAAGSYTIGAFFPSHPNQLDGDAFVAANGPNIPVVTTPGWLTYGQGVFASGTESFVRPTGVIGDTFNPSFFGPNFLSTGVPEPSMWIMMIFGFGAIGFAMRRSRNQRARLAAA